MPINVEALDKIGLYSYVSALVYGRIVLISKFASSYSPEFIIASKSAGFLSLLLIADVLPNLR